MRPSKPFVEKRIQLDLAAGGLGLSNKAGNQLVFITDNDLVLKQLNPFEMSFDSLPSDSLTDRREGTGEGRWPLLYRLGYGPT